MAVKCILTGQTPSVLDGVTENVQTQLNDKVDKVTGKGLSTNDYTDAEKTKLSGIETGAQKNTITGVKGNAETTYRKGNVNITATNIGLGNVNNTSDAEKPISNATQAALNAKQSSITANGILKGDGSGGVSAAVKGTDYDTEIGIVHYEDSFDSVEAAYNKSKRLFCSENPADFVGTYSDKLYALLNRSQPYFSDGKVEITYTFTCLDKTITLTRTKRNSTATPVDTWAKGSQAFNPRLHASTHKTGGGDAIAPSDIGAQTKIKANGVLKGDGSGNISVATAADIPGLSGKQAKITGAATTITDNNLTANRALISNSSGKVEVSSVTSTELGYLDGVTSNIQTQLNNKLSSAPVTSVNNKTGAVSLAAGDVGAQPSITANGILKGDGSGNITAASETEVELVSLPNICNPNLLDNWYFGNPVNQRNGYVIPPKGAGHLYSDAACTSLISGGTIDAYRQVTQTSTGNYSYSIDEGTFYVKASDVVRGYTGVGYGIDRWQLAAWNANSIAMTVEADGVRLIGTSASPNTAQLQERIQSLYFPAGSEVTASILVTALGANGGELYLFLCKSDGTPIGSSFIRSVGLHTFTMVIPDDIGDFVILAWGQHASFGGSGNTDITIKAAKLELGSQQTLAHQENGAWVLNEIPDYGEQLRRCQRYFWKVDYSNWPGVAPFSGTYNGERITLNGLTFPVTMRTKPTISNLILYDSGSGASEAVTDSEWGLFDYVYNNIFPTSENLVSGHTYSVQHAEFSADL